MKKVLLTMIACAGIGFTHAQVQLNNATNLLSPVGNIGIKTLNPTESLEIGKGTIKINDYKDTVARMLYVDPNGLIKSTGISIPNPQQQAVVITSTLPTEGFEEAPYWSLYGNNEGVIKNISIDSDNTTSAERILGRVANFGLKTPTNIRFFQGGLTSFVINTDATLNVREDASFQKGTNFVGIANFSNDIKANRVIIGNPSTVGPNSKLVVEGLISAREVKVLTGPIPDYVFEQDYTLMSLSDLETYIKTNKHLPGIPSASEVEANEGLELGEMNRLLLEKVEELTLHIIAQQKEIETLKSALK
jgi:hypothetical protein